MPVNIGRRELIAALGSAATWPLTARAQQSAKIQRIGIIDDAPMWHSFRQALHELGYVEGQNVNYEYRYSEGVPDRLATVVNELIRLPVDLITTYGTPPTQTAKAATTTIPIVMVGVGDPVRAGLVASLARPGGNLTGNTVLSPDLGAKRLQLLREAIAGVSRVAYLVNSDNAGTLDVLAELRAAASAAGMVLIGVEFSSATDFDSAVAVMLRERVEVLLVSTDPFHQLHIGRIIDFLAKNQIAGMFQSKENVRRRPHSLRREPARPVPARRRVRAPHPARHQARPPSSRAADQVRSSHQPQKLPACSASTCHHCSSPALTR